MFAADKIALFTHGDVKNIYNFWHKCYNNKLRDYDYLHKI